MARVGGSTTIPQLVQLAIATWVGAWVRAAMNDFYQLNQWNEEDTLSATVIARIRPTSHQTFQAPWRGPPP